ncbi:hypothetical protein LOTGIDRAFT_159731 [Lottia gigantea]|uniref:C-type lectin domain-containing protein n=1 Tax=Lottia gigantea TaxID=225164 RepID=V3ZZK7_LOTGI|nr:hypothetical protein LOTGIDRAFT_159731 [Lottia gigantea]ESO96983.1 hypothetical protein LOTGIDRAFT_159731 [Lottia gigantea]
MAVNCHFVVYFGLVFLYSTVADITVHPQEDFNTAQADCSGRGLSLPVAETYEEYELLLQYLNDNNINTNVWLGLKVPDGETRFKWVNDGYKEGGYLQTEWADDEPNNLDVPESCVRLKSDDDFKWNTRDCTKESEFICVNYSKSDTDFELFTTQKNYGEARQFCQGRSKDLPMLKTRNQYDLILDKINTDSSIKNIWIGMMFVGSQDDDYREFKWFDGERIDTADWDTSASGSCVYMDSSDSFKWKPVSCSTARSYVCTPTFRIHNAYSIENKAIGNFRLQSELFVLSMAYRRANISQGSGYLLEADESGAHFLTNRRHKVKLIIYAGDSICLPVSGVLYGRSILINQFDVVLISCVSKIAASAFVPIP